jgi:uncharacterized protein with NRDE domain
MCLVLFAFGNHPTRPLVVAANRDEFYRRPALPAHPWQADQRVLAGKDLEADGTWLGVTTAGRFAAVTNLSEPMDDAPLSRGALVSGFLQGGMSSRRFAEDVEGTRYRGFNLLLWDGEEMVYSSNRAPTQVLQPGVYGVSNAVLGAEWPKVQRGRNALSRTLAGEPHPDALISLLADDSTPPDHELPDRGRPLDLERRVAPCFIRGDDYGTRASTAVIISHDAVSLTEQLYGPGGTTGSRAHLHRSLHRPLHRTLHQRGN